jgi:hypothetical protein
VRGKLPASSVASSLLLFGPQVSRLLLIWTVGVPPALQRRIEEQAGRLRSDKRR